MKNITLETREALDEPVTVEELLRIARREIKLQETASFVEMVVVMTFTLTVIGIFAVLRLKAMGLL